MMSKKELRQIEKDAKKSFEEHESTDAENLSEEESDFTIQRESNIFLVHPKNENAKKWIKENVFKPMYFGSAIVVDQHYLESLIIGMIKEGFKIE